MTFDEREVLRRFHRALVRELQASAEDLETPFTVAEIYQNLVPYRTHRDELMVEMNGDYEHALLRLLAGEGDYLTIESRTARQELQDELTSPNPNTGLFRDFAAADVRLNPHVMDEALAELDIQEVGMTQEEVQEEEGGEGQGETFQDGDDAHEDPEGTMEEEALDSPELLAEVSEDDSEASEGEGEGEEGIEGGDPDADPGSEGVGGPDEEDRPPFEACPWCRESLPQRGGVKFCPFCGSNVQLVPCPTCGEELELNWRFCIACGMEVDS
jgi:hypothetical protein